MKPFHPWSVIRRVSCSLVLCGVALGLAPVSFAAQFLSASQGPISIYSSDSPENTREFLCEIMEVRRQLQDLIAPVALPNPRMQVVIFSNLQDYKDFIPHEIFAPNSKETVSGFSSSDYGLTAAVVKNDRYAYEFGRDVVLYYYARHLLLSVLPYAPVWVQIGLPDVLAATKARRGRLYIGGDFMDHYGNFRPAKAMPLARLMDDKEMRPHANRPSHDHALYHESWALWQNWLTSADPRHRQQIRRFFADLQNGAAGDFEQLARSFGETTEAIEAFHRSRRQLQAVVSQADAAMLVPGLVFQPATELDRKFALAMLLAGASKVSAAYNYELHQLAQAHPASPRPREALAVVATVARDMEGAVQKWEQARELGTDNPYAYFLPVKSALDARQFYFNFQAQLPEATASRLKDWLDRCVQLDPGYGAAHYYRTVLEAFAPQPDRAMVDTLERSQMIASWPRGWIYLAIARWRLGQRAEAHQLLEQLRARPRLAISLQTAADQLQAAMRESEKKAAKAAN
jgi:hypothetical protein